MGRTDTGPIPVRTPRQPEPSTLPAILVGCCAGFVLAVALLLAIGWRPNSSHPVCISFPGGTACGVCR